MMKVNKRSPASSVAKPFRKKALRAMGAIAGVLIDEQFVPIATTT